MIGKDPIYVQIELKRRILVRECLLRDDRITEVDNFKFEVTGDEIKMHFFDVHSIFGNFTASREVNI